jgi:alanyl-tRNA synthetase
VRFGRQSLGVRDPFLFNLVPVIIDSMGEAFPELKKNPNRVSETIKDEEISFGRTIDRGIDLFEEAASRASATKAISAQDAFRLHDTYGFPIDLTRIMAEERGMSVDMAGYEQLMEEAKELARAGGKGKASAVYDLPPAILADLEKQGVAKTDDSSKFDVKAIDAKVVAVWNGSRLWHDAVRSNEEIALILDRTNFYAEMGGQVGDSGVVASATMNFDVETTRIVGGYVLHVGKLKSGQLKSGDSVTATVSNLRIDTQKNHTATHLANWALREVLGDSVQQKGSLVDAEKLRFDFSHGKSLSDDEIITTEKLVNDGVARKMPVYAEVAPQDQALKINSLRAVFGEKYPPMVRVVSIGTPVKDLLADPNNSTWREYSIEFCGGTHLRNTSEIERFVITSEESVSKGIRRIVAVTGVAASAAPQKTKSLTDAVNRAKSAPEPDLPKLANDLQRLAGEPGIALSAKRQVQHAIGELQQKYKAWEKSHKAAASTIDASKVADDLLAGATTHEGSPIVVAEVKDASDDQLRAVMDSVRKKSPSIGLMLAATDGVKITFIAAVSDDLIAKGLKAGDWIRDTAKAAGGGGGGRPNMAQAGGKDPAKLGEALQVAKTFVAKMLG